MQNTATAKRLANTQGISVREAEQQLDANAYLHKQWWWTHGGLQHEYLFQQMFQHAVLTGQSEYECAICWGQRDPLPEQDLAVEPTAMELVGLNSMCQDIENLYCDVYLLCRLPGQSRCEEAMMEHLWKEILDSIKEHFRLKQPPAQQEKQWTQLLANTPRPDAHMAFATTNGRTYEQMMALTRDAWQWALVATVILGEWMESMSHSTSCWYSISHRCLASHRRSRSLGWWEGFQVTPHCGETEARPDSSQMNSHQEGMVDIDFFKHQRTSWVTSCWGVTNQKWT